MQDIRWSWKRTVDPVLLPVTIEEAKRECGIYDDDSVNDHFRELIIQATAQVENDSRRALMTQTWKLWLDQFPCDGIQLRKCPVQSVTHVKYYTSSVQTTWSSSLYQTDLDAQPALIEPVDGQTWPTVDSNKLKAIEIQWVAGYATQAALKTGLPNARSAVLLAVRGLYYGGCTSPNYDAMITRIKVLGYTA